MSNCLKLIRYNQLLRRGFLSHGTNLTQPQISCHVPHCQSRFSGTSSKKPENEHKEVKDDIKYVIKFKTTDIKGIFKQFYSLYGPLFIACHIGVSLTSLGTFSALVWLSIDLSQLMPDYVLVRLGPRMSDITNDGGKFVIAYAIHKLILPFRLLTSIALTRYLAPKIKLLRK